MKYKYIKMWFGKTIVTSRLDKVSIDCPNGFGGIGHIKFYPVEPMWSGSCHISIHKAVEVGIAFCSLTGIELGNDFVCEEAEWVDFWTVDNGGQFSYKYWQDTADKIRELQKDDNQ